MDWQLKLSRALRVATEAARYAGAHLMHEFSRVGPEDAVEKGPGDFVTKTDRESERLIKQRIRMDFPDDVILSEEAGGPVPDSEFLWLVDPLDGTTNFIHRFPFFCVSIAFTANRRPEVGVIYDPLHDDIFTCKRDEGVWLNGSPILVSSCADPARAYVATGFPSRFREEADGYARGFRNVLTSVSGLRRGGSAALDLAYVACGRFDGFWEPRLASWDMAAGALLVETAGGVVSDESGKAWNFSSRGIIAGNPAIHPFLVRLLTA